MDVPEDIQQEIIDKSFELIEKASEKCESCGEEKCEKHAGMEETLQT